MLMPPETIGAIRQEHPEQDRVKMMRSVKIFLCFEITVDQGGSIWGTGVYTDDSTLATAVVHAGIYESKAINF